MHNKIIIYQAAVMKALRDSSMSLATARELLQSQKEKSVKCDNVHDMEKTSYWNLSAYWQLLLLLGTFLMSLLTALHDILFEPKKAGIKMELMAEGNSEVSKYPNN